MTQSFCVEVINYIKMQKHKKRKINNQSGAAMLISIIFFLFISLAIIAGLVSPSVREFKNASMSLNSKRALFLAESGSEDAYYRIIKNKTIENTEVITLDSNTATTTIESLGDGGKQISSLGDVSSYQRQVAISLSTGSVVSFTYGAQIGEGGLSLSSGTIDGSVYSNGPIVADSSSGNLITGSAVSANNKSGVEGLISGADQNNLFNIGSTSSDTAQAHTVNYVNATGNIFCQIGIDNSSACLSQGDPSYRDLPITDAKITEWKEDAEAGGVRNGNYSVGYAGATIGPKKIIGNLTVSGGGILVVTGTLWVTGSVSLSGGSTIMLDPSYGSSDGLIVADGTISLGGGGFATGSGTDGSFIMLLSTSNKSTAVTISGGSGATIAYAPFGTINIKGGASINEASGYKILISGDSKITYDPNLMSNSFYNGSSGLWALQKWGEK